MMSLTNITHRSQTLESRGGTWGKVSLREQPATLPLAQLQVASELGKNIRQAEQDPNLPCSASNVFGQSTCNVTHLC